jgi:asparagine synthase (glutamine-hydrolysing)
MCGIAGFISLQKNYSPQQLKQASDTMSYRGPDADGFYFSADNIVGLAHRRLSIIDLSNAANQPMFSADGRYCIVFNGEIYNFNELKLLLKDGGQSLKTTGDTEVIVELFAQMGNAFFSKLNGMFAFAIYDLAQNQLTVCRDHVGIKPLFYYIDSNTVVFASEIKVIKSLLGNKLLVNKAAIPYFLHVGFIPQPQTIFQQVYKFPSASYATINCTAAGIASMQSAIKPFWQLASAIEQTTHKNELVCKKDLNNLLLDAVEKQLVSDVPIGTFLSGGIDSSLVTALAANINKGSAINTFSIAIDDGKYNESKFAKAVATHLHTNHHEFAVKEKEVMELVDKIIPAYDEPFADSSALPTMMVSRLARQHVTVALSGDGGDELFHGYGMYSWANRLSNPYLDFVKRPLAAITSTMNSRFQRIGQMFDVPNNKHLYSHIFSQEQYYFKEKELQDLLVEPIFNFNAINQKITFNRTLSAVEQQSYWDFEHYLKDDLLVKVDRASMQYSLESRVPLLDYRLVEFAYNVDGALKINNGAMKYLLKEVLYQYVPKAIFDRPKWGFSIPLGKWLQTDLKYLLDNYTSKQVIEQFNVVNFQAVEKLKKQYFNGSTYLYNRLWLIMVLHWWLSANATSNKG